MSSISAALSDWKLNADFDSANTDRIQAAFEALDSSKLIYQGGQGRLNLTHYTRLVAARPKELRNHVKRVYLATAINDREEIAAAMVDLFWVLEDKAPAFRKKLLGQLAPILDQKVKSVLLSSMAKNDKSVLKQFVSDRTVIVNGSYSRVVDG